MRSKTPRVVVVKSASHIRIVAHPLRLEIIERLKLDGPDSIAGLARRLERRANGLTYHVRLLERAGILVRSGIRKAGRREEVVYGLAGQRIAVAADAMSRPMLRAVSQTAGAVLRIAEREIRHALSEGLADADQLAGRPLGRRQRAWLTDDDVAAVHRRLERLEHHLERCSRKKRGRPYALTVVLVPLGPERKS